MYLFGLIFYPVNINNSMVINKKRVKIATLIAALKADDEIKVRRKIFTFKTLIYV